MTNLARHSLCCCCSKRLSSSGTCSADQFADYGMLSVGEIFLHHADKSFNDKSRLHAPFQRWCPSIYAYTIIGGRERATLAYNQGWVRWPGNPTRCWSPFLHFVKYSAYSSALILVIGLHNNNTLTSLEIDLCFFRNFCRQHFSRGIGNFGIKPHIATINTPPRQLCHIW